MLATSTGCSSGLFSSGFLLLGAGASVEANVPPAFGFIETIRSYLYSLQPKSTREALLSAYEEVLLQLEEAYGKENVSLEPLYEAVDDSLEAHFAKGAIVGLGGAKPILQPSRAIERLHYEIKRVIQTHCLVTDGKRGAYLHPLLQRLAEFPAFPIVSFNYDSVVEASCAMLGLSCREFIFGEQATKREFELVKVHGSVTWITDRSGKVERRPLNASSTIRQLRAFRSPTLETPMIYPSRRKMPLHGPFMMNALRLQELLATKQACIAIGYSFSDAHMRTWLANAFKANPHLTLYLIDPNPGRAIRNLVMNLPTVQWTKRLRIVSENLGEAIRKGIENCLERSRWFGSQFADLLETPIWSNGAKRCFDGKCSGLGAAPDGSALYVAQEYTGRLFRVALHRGEARKPELFAQGLKAPRGITVSQNGDVLVVQNQLLRRALGPTVGLGSVIKIKPPGHRESLFHLRMSELRRTISALNQGIASAELWPHLPSLLRWPTDIAIAPDGTIYVTEARALVQLDGTTTSPLHRSYEGGLLFNLHGIDVTDDEALVGVEQGIAQDGSWGRVHRFVRSGSGFDSFRVALDGAPKLMGICFVPKIRQVIVTKGWSWPLGGLYTLDYPNLDNPRFLGGFDLPHKVRYIPLCEKLAVSSPDGVHLIPIELLRNARSIKT